MDSQKECISYLIFLRSLHELRLNLLPECDEEECLDEVMFINTYDMIISFLKKDKIGE